MIVTLYRTRSDFLNMPDQWDFSGDPDASHLCREFKVHLPDGYSLGKTQMGEKGIFGPDNMACVIITHSSGLPQLAGSDPRVSPVMTRAK